MADNNKICVVCGRTFPQESNDDVCGSCRLRIDSYQRYQYYNDGYEKALKDIGQLLDDIGAVGASDEDWDNIVESLKQGKMPE